MLHLTAVHFALDRLLLACGPIWERARGPIWEGPWPDLGGSVDLPLLAGAPQAVGLRTLYRQLRPALRPLTSPPRAS